MSSPNSFTSLLAADPHQQPTAGPALDREVGDRKGSGVSKFKTLPPPSLPISPPAPASPFSYFGLSPAEFLDSPIQLSSSNILPSPTTGTFSSSSWKSDSNRIYQQETKPEQKNYSDFSFQPNTVSTGFATREYYQEPAKQDNLPPEENYLNSEFNPTQQIDQYNESSVLITENNKLDDGYNWRKYGQKQVKGSENPRSYYKCTHPNCPTKKNVERSLSGQITEIVYKGSHNHAKPQSVRRSSALAPCSSTVLASSVVIQSQNEKPEQLSDGSVGAGKWDSLVATPPENSSISIGDDEFVYKNKYDGGNGFDEDEPDMKIWKGEDGSENAGGMGSKTVREPRVVVQTKSDIDILVDGYRWRKYGQKVVKGNPNPRSYYKCTSPSCPVRKHVERASHDPKSVITTYEGRHNHDVPASRGGGNHALTRPVPYNPSNNVAMSGALPVRSGAVDAEAFTLEMLTSPARSLRYSGFGNMMGSGIDLLQDNALFSRAKDEPRADMFLDSFLS